MDKNYSQLLTSQSQEGRCGVDLQPLKGTRTRTGLLVRDQIGLPEVTEPQVVKHFTKLSQLNFSIDTNFYPLGSCTMKHNPKLNEKMARLAGFTHIHPLQHPSMVQGALKLMVDLENWLCVLTNMPAASLVPAAGAHGELTGVMTIRKAHESKGNPRKIILVPDNAHGTNPATANMCGYETKAIPSTSDGFVDMDALKAALNEDVAAFMLTNPSTCGLFEIHMKEIANMLHSVGAYFYCDGANFNAIVGKVCPGDLGVDVMQFNLHKTFSTPHGGGGPGCGPITVSHALKEYLPVPRVMNDGSDVYMVSEESQHSIGRIRSFFGQFGVMVRALTYMLSHGQDGLRQVAEDAVLNANYILSQLKDVYHAPYDGPCMHECILSDKNHKETGTTLDIAKMLMDHNIHPMTVYFPLVVQGAMLIEPTETETKESIDHFITAMKDIAKTLESGNGEAAKQAPFTAPRKRVDEVGAARKPVLSCCG